LSKDIPSSSKTKDQNKNFMANKDRDFEIIDLTRNHHETAKDDEKIINDIPEEKIKMNFDNLPEMIKYLYEKNLTNDVRYFYLNYALLIQVADNLVTLALATFSMYL
jgi:hypothetical protein